MFPINNFTVFESIYGRIIVNRHCAFQAEALAKTGQPHIQSELNNLLTIANTLPNNAVIIDGGANIGLVTIPLAQMGKTRGWKLHAFEPQRMLYNALCGSLALNDLENAWVYRQGLGESLSKFMTPAVDYSVVQDYGTVELSPLVKNKADVGEAVEVVTIDSLSIDRLDLLKLDIEGMEISALRGAKQIITKHLPWCWIEYWKVGTPSICAQFSGLNYQFFKVDNLNLICAPSEKLKSSGLDMSNIEEVK